MRPGKTLVWRGRRALALLPALFLASGPAGATENLREELAEVAKQVKALMEKERQEGISVGAFSGPSHLPMSGALIQKTLAEELTRLGVTVSKDAKNYEVKGDFRDAPDPRVGNLVGVKLSVRVYDASGEELVKFKSRIVHGNNDLLQLLGPTAAISPKGDLQERNKKIEEAIKKPSVHIDGTRVSAAPGSPYAVEVVVKSGKEYAPCKPEVKDGLAVVALKRDDVYAVVLYNNSPHEAGCRLSIDGLSMFAFSEVKDAKTGGPKYNHVIVPKGGCVQVEGWHVTNKKSDEFRITGYAESAAGKLGRTGEVGTVTVAFCAAWPKGKDEMRPPDELQGRDADLGTGRGARIDKEYEEVERDYGVVRAVVSIRYGK
jgi:hypothetical protein